MPELNLSADPEAAHRVLHDVCPVTLMNAHVCLQAPVGWPDLWRAGFWDREMRRIVRRWLLMLSIYWGVPVFYLWDLPPAVYVSHPELFDEHRVVLRSTVSDLETGTLAIGEAGEAGGTCINMPSQILDPKRLRTILFEAWRLSSSRC